MIDTNNPTLMAMDSSPEQDTTSSSSSSSRKDLFKIDPVEVGKSELCFVTSINLPTGTFFAQLCKNTSEELAAFDVAVNDYCNKKIATNPRGHLESSRPTKISLGQYVCVKYQNGFWYRALVLSRNKSSQSCTLLYVDYGDIGQAKFDELVTVDLDEIPSFKRAPFGITCSLSGSSRANVAELDRALRHLANIYLLINIVGQKSSLQWEVEVPRLAYNMPFWDQYDPKTGELLRSNRFKGERAPLALDEQAPDAPPPPEKIPFPEL